VGIWDWLFGKKDHPAAAGTKERTPAPTENHHVTSGGDCCQQATAPAASAAPSAADPEAENLRRWRESGQPRRWVEAHRGSWNHNDWLSLLEELKRSPYWPMHPNAIGAVLEEAKGECLRRN
jgi:hypothetical protein